MKITKNFNSLLKNVVNKNNLSACSLAVLAAAMAPMQAVSQEDESASSRVSNAQRVMEEVVVQARKKSSGEAIQTVPQAITGLSSDQLDAIGAEDLTDVGSFSPNVILGETKTLPGTASFYIRGQGTSQSVQSFQPSVGVFQDGVYMGLLVGSILDTFDVESIEIMRGPQGTLFGRNVSGGGVSVRTTRPTGEFGGKVRATMGSEDTRGLSAQVNLPVNDKLAGLISLRRSDADGYVDSTTVDGLTFGGTGSTYARTAWTYTPTDDLDLTLIAYSWDQDGDGSAFGAAVNPPTPGYVGPSQREDYWEISSNFEGYTEQDVSGVTLESNWKLSNGLISAVYGHRSVDYNAAMDGDGTDTDFFKLYSLVDQSQDSLELRYASEGLSWGDYTVGIFYWDSELEASEGRNIAGGRVLQASNGREDNRAYSVFSQFDINLSDNLILNAGLRWNKESKDASIAPLLSGGCGVANVDFNDFKGSFDKQACAYLTDDASWSNVSPKVGMQWMIDDNSQAYFSYTTGYRSGSYNVREAGSTTVLNPADEETTNAFEIGYKNTLLDGAMIFNAALFRNDIDDFMQVSTTADNAVSSTIVNVGEVTIQGVELELSGLITDSFSYQAALGYVDAEYQKLNLPEKETDPLGWDLDRVPEITGSLSLIYDMEVSDLGYLSLRSTYTHVDENSASFDRDANPNIIAARNEVNASATFESMDESWKLIFSGKNLTEEQSAGNRFYVGPYLLEAINPGRTWTLSAEYNF